jgi:hypothetical protein
MSEQPDEPEQQVRRQVTYESISTSSTKSTTITIVIVLVIAIALIAWIMTQM